MEGCGARLWEFEIEIGISTAHNEIENLFGKSNMRRFSSATTNQTLHRSFFGTRSSANKLRCISDWVKTQPNHSDLSPTSDVAANLGLDDIKRLPAKFLRLSGNDCYDLSSYQRTDVVIDLEDGKPLEPKSIDWKNQAIKSVTKNNETGDYVVEFEDGTVSEYASDWVKTQLNRMDLSPTSDVATNLPRIPWSDVTEDDFRSIENRKHSMTMSFEDIVLNGHDICTNNMNMHSDSDSDNDGDRDATTSKITNIENAMKILYQSGILLVTSTPVLGDHADASIAALGSALSGATYKHSPDTSPLAQYQHCVKHNLTPRLDLEHGTDGPHRTLFGKVWSTHSSKMTEGTSTADSAYGNDALPLHTGKRDTIVD